MKQYTVELDEMVCCWLEHISKVTGESVEKIISNGIFHLIARLENGVVQSFSYNEQQ